jgi:hypothetical protein
VPSASRPGRRGLRKCEFIFQPTSVEMFRWTNGALFCSFPSRGKASRAKGGENNSKRRRLGMSTGRLSDHVAHPLRCPLHVTREFQSKTETSLLPIQEVIWPTTRQIERCHCKRRQGAYETPGQRRKERTSSLHDIVVSSSGIRSPDDARICLVCTRPMVAELGIQLLQ